MGQCGENDHIGLRRDFVAGNIVEAQCCRGPVVRNARENFGESFAGELPRCNDRKVGARMTQKQAHQLFAGVTGSSNDRHPGAAAEDSVLYIFFHDAQCVLRLRAIATKD